MDSSNGSTISGGSNDNDVQHVRRSAPGSPEARAEIPLAGSEDAVSIERHRNMMLATLLEDHYRSRALEFLNATNPGRQFTRQSREVDILTRQLYSQAGRVLTSNGLLSSGETSDESRGTRRQYLAGLDSLFAGTQMPDILESMRQVVTQTSQLNLSGHPANDLQLALHQPAPPPRSHYRSSFREDCLLGRGGFGKVYQCYNHLDQKTYAVKKIILPPKLVKSLSDGNHDKLQHILREAKAMAMLDHPNIVRYHATWFEEPQRSPELFNGPDTPRNPLSRRGTQLLLDSQAFAESSEQESTYSGGIVFGEDTPTHQSAVAADNNGDSVANRGWSEGDMSLSVVETTSAAESDIFTGGMTGQENLPSCQSTLDTDAHALYIQMSVYPMTLAQFISPSGSSTTGLRHCFHLVPTLRLMLSIHDGLQYIHSKGLIHRDIKPGNIFLSSPSDAFDNGYCDSSCRLCTESEEASSTSKWLNPRIGDFGLVHQLAQDEMASPFEDCNGSKNEPGTAFYQPPRRGEKKDEKIDIYALGVVFVEMLCRCNTAMERVHMLTDLQDGEVPWDLQQNLEEEGYDSETAKRVVQLVSAMTDEDSDQRWSGSQVREALLDLLSRCEC